jgi:hypothetical protein
MALGGAFEAEHLGAVMLKGKLNAVEVFALGGPGSGS